MLKKRHVVLTGCVAILLVVPAAEQSLGQAFDPPAGGWAYIYNGDTAANDETAALDGTWNSVNGSDQWDGTAPGTGNPGGAGVFTEGTDTFLRIQDTGDPRGYGFSDPGSNRKVYLTHDVGANGASDTVVDDGFTLSFRARVPTTGVLDELHEAGGASTAPWPADGNGLFIADRKSTFSVQQRVGTDKSINFALALPADHSEAGATGGLLMNQLNGTVPTNINTGEAGTPNLLPLDDPTAWNEFWIVVQPGGSGTHQATIWINGDSKNSTVFDLTAGDRSEGPFDSVLAMGSSATPQDGAVDIDFIAFMPSALQPGLIPGDVNGDEIVDLLDLDIIRMNFFESDKVLSEGDLNLDNIVDFFDYRIWTENSSVGFAPLAVPVPEPACLGIALLGGVLLLGIRQRIGSTI